MIPSNDLDWSTALHTPARKVGTTTTRNGHDEHRHTTTSHPTHRHPRHGLAPPQPGTAMTNTDTPPPATPHTITPDVVADAVTAELDDLYQVGVSRAQAVDSLHSVANELLQPLITLTPGPAQRRALAYSDALRAAATVLADHDNDPGTWTPDELQHGDTAAANQAAESPTLAAAPPTPPTDAPPPAPTDAPPPPPPPPTDAPPPPPQYPPGLDVSKYVRAPLAPQHPGRT